MQQLRPEPLFWKPMTAPGVLHNEAAGDVDLRRLAGSVWKRRMLVCGCIVVGVVAGAWLSVMGAHWVSQGLLLTPQVTIEDYKRYSGVLSNEFALAEFLEHSGKNDSPSAALLREIVKDPAEFAASVSPEFSFTDRDARIFGVSSKQGATLTGIRLQLVQKARAQEPPVLLLGENVRDVAIKEDLESAILSACLENERRELELRNDELEGQFQVDQIERKIERLGSIIRDVPGATALEGRQVISLEKDAERFLSPTAQLVGAKVELAELEEASRVRERRRVAARIHRNYYCAARDAISGQMSGRAFLESLKGIREQALKGQDLSLGAVELVANSIDLQREGWVSKYLSQMRFVAAPEGTQRPVRRMGLLTGVILGAAVGALLGVLLAGLAGWWRQNRAVIVAVED